MANIRRGALGIGVIALAVLAIVLWRTRRDDHTEESSTSTNAGSAVEGRPGERTRVQRGKTWLAQPGIGDRRIAGVVTTEDGTPVRGANVRIASNASRAGMLAEPRLVTDDQGRFDAGALPAMWYLVSADAKGMTPAAEWTDARSPTARPSSDRLHLVMHPCIASIHGTIRDAAGGVVAGAHVARTDEKLTIGGVETDANGAFELCLPPGKTQVAVSADGYAAINAAVNVFGRTRRDFELEPGATVVGRIVRAADQTPVHGALVELRSLDRDEIVLHATANDEGRFEIEGVMTGRHHVTATAEGLASAEPVEAAAQLGAPSDEVVVPLVTAHSVVGKVVEKESGKPIAGIGVRALPMTRSTQEARGAMAQTDGTFVIERLLPGTYQVTTTADSWGEGQKRTVTVANADVKEFVVELARGATIAGRVLHAGKPVDGVWVRTEGGPFDDTTDHEGRFTLEHVPAGSYKVYAESMRHGAFTRTKPVTVVAGETRNLDLELDLAGSIEGVVVDQHGAPVPSVFVGFTLLGGDDEGSATTADDGRFTARALSGGGDYVYEVRQHDGAALRFSPASGKRFAPITLANGGTRVTGVRIAIRYERHSITGRVLDDAGNPKPDVRVTAMGTESRSVEMSATTDQRGAFTLRDLPAGAYTVDARSLFGYVKEENVQAGRAGLMLTMRGFSSIDGVLEDFTSTPRVLARHDSGVRYGAIVSGTTFKLRELPSGSYEITAFSDTEAGIVRATTRPGTPATVTLAKQATGILEGTVRDEKGAPVAEVYCQARLQGGEGSSALTYTMSEPTGPSGTFHIERVMPGIQEVTCDGSAEARRPVTVTPGQVARIDLTLRAPHAHDVATAGLAVDVKLGELRVSAITPGGPAARAGVAVGDVLIKVNDALVKESDGYRATRAFEAGRVGDTVKLVLERADKQFTVSVVLVADDDDD